jgi:uncharacterized peroxidase-related enzyme
VRIFPSLPDNPGMGEVFARFPHTASALGELHDLILSDASPLTVAEREFIAAFVSGLNACTYCHGAHVIAAENFGINPDELRAALDDIASARVDNRLKPILAYVRKLTLTPSRIEQSDADAVWAAGWEEQALFDAISVCALFNFINRIIEGSGVRSDPLMAPPDEMAARRARLGRPGTDPHLSERRYSVIMSKWIAEP